MRITDSAVAARTTAVALVMLFGSCLAPPALGQAVIPRRITAERLHEALERYATLSPEQTAAIDMMHEAYTANWSASFNDEIKAFSALWSRVYVAPDDFKGESMAAALDEALNAAEALSSKLRLANETFFGDVEVTLADEQLPGLQRVRLAHERVTYRRSRNYVPEQHIDIIALIEQLTLTPEEQTAVDDLLALAEPGYVVNMREAAEAQTRASRLQFQALENIRRENLIVDDPSQGTTPERARQMEVSRKANDALGGQATRITTPSSRRLVESNRRILRQVCSALSPANAAELMRQYNEAAYPDVYPDPMFAGPCFDAAIAAAPAMDPDRRAALESLRATYEREHANACSDMAEAIYALALVPTKHTENFGIEAYLRDRKAVEVKIRDAGLKREELDLAQPARIRALLLPNEVARLPEWRWSNAPPLRLWAQIADVQTPESQVAEQAWRMENALRERDARRREAAATQSAATQPAATNPGE